MSLTLASGSASAAGLPEQLDLAHSYIATAIAVLDAWQSSAVPKQFAKRTLAAMAIDMGNVATELASDSPNLQLAMPIALTAIIDARNVLQLAGIGLANEDRGLLSIASDRLRTDLGKVYSPSSADQPQ